MLKRLAGLILIAAVTSILSLCLSASVETRATQTPDSTQRTVWNGVFTDAQAARGQKAYLDNCSACHGADLSGVARLKGDDFMERWREFDVGGLYDFISKSMPRRRPGSENAPGSLSENTYLDIISFIFKSNSFPAGSQELVKAAMKSIQIEGKDGPKPVPNGALVQFVGCLTKRGTDWVLINATEPARTSTSNASTAEELERAKAKPLGELQFALQNIGFIGGDFDPAVHATQRMQAKGFLTRQPGNNRISVTSLEAIAPTCR